MGLDFVAMYRIPIEPNHQAFFLKFLSKPNYYNFKSSYRHDKIKTRVWVYFYKHYKYSFDSHYQAQDQARQVRTMIGSLVGSSCLDSTVNGPALCKFQHPRTHKKIIVFAFISFLFPQTIIDSTIKRTNKDLRVKVLTFCDRQGHLIAEICDSKITGVRNYELTLLATTSTSWDHINSVHVILGSLFFVVQDHKMPYGDEPTLLIELAPHDFCHHFIQFEDQEPDNPIATLPEDFIAHDLLQVPMVAHFKKNWSYDYEWRRAFSRHDQGWCSHYFCIYNWDSDLFTCLFAFFWCIQSERYLDWAPAPPLLPSV